MARCVVLYADEDGGVLMEFPEVKQQTMILASKRGATDDGAPSLEGMRTFVLVSDEHLCLLEEIIEGIGLEYAASRGK